MEREVLRQMQSEYKDDQFVDDQNHSVIWRFNVHSFVVDQNESVNTETQNLRNDPHFRVQPNGQGPFQYRGFILQKQHINPEQIPAEGEAAPVAEEGNLDGFVVTVNDEYYDPRQQESHTKGHEAAHFFLRLHPDPAKRNPPNTVAGHLAAGGGILSYATAHFNYPGQIRTPDQHPTVSFTDLHGLTQQNVTDILHSVPQRDAPPQQPPAQQPAAAPAQQQRRAF